MFQTLPRVMPFKSTRRRVDSYTYNYVYIYIHIHNIYIYKHVYIYIWQIKHERREHRSSLADMNADGLPHGFEVARKCRKVSFSTPCDVAASGTNP